MFNKKNKEAKARQASEEKARLEKVRLAEREARLALEREEQARLQQSPSLTQELGAAGEGGSWFRRGVTKTREALTQGLAQLTVGKKEISPALMEELEELLLTADMGVATTKRLLERVERSVARKELNDPARLKELLREEVESILLGAEPAERLEGANPGVILFVGVNGVGKTTTIGKLAARFQAEGKRVLLAAGDTFRAAAAEQLAHWAERTGAGFYGREAGADPSSVIHQALKKGLEEKWDRVLCDTAGRLHTKTNLLEELKKIKRVAGAVCPGAPHEVWLVLDANTGQNAIHQTRQFLKAVEVTGLVLTKLDGTAKGGVVVGITNEFHIPIRFVGLGEGVEDLRVFDPKAFAQSLFD
ncbi:MAG: signal recognition particle-docking protein FtsY [Deltaproteobacteria bacterium]|nr:signal recognition particle-docking protein FtsY [Deltaproteobacteria bacterium]